MLLSPFTVASIIPFHATVLKMGGDIEIECQSLLAGALETSTSYRSKGGLSSSQQKDLFVTDVPCISA
jgi:hypothetical protein